MPTSFEILKRRGLVYIRHSGIATFEESQTALGQCAAHPDFDPSHKHLVDCRDVIRFERDYARLMALQAQIADVVIPHQSETLLVFLATTQVAREVATLVQQSWEGSGTVIPRGVQNEADALAFLGQPETRIADMLATMSTQES